MRRAARACAAGCRQGPTGIGGQLIRPTPAPANGSVLIAGGGSNGGGSSYLRVIENPLPGTSGTDNVVPSESGEQLYRFDAAGRHLDTRDAATGAVLIAFAYDSIGRLSSVTDNSGNVTTFVRDTLGRLDRILGPYGQTTEVSLDAHGFISSLEDPAGSQSQFTYTDAGLMTTMVDVRGGLHAFEYDDVGRLISDSGPEDVVKTLESSLVSSTRTISSQTGGGLQSVYRSVLLPTGGTRSEQSTAGLTNFSDVLESGGTAATFADGMRITSLLGADPRFGMAAPFLARKVETTPAGFTRTVLRARSFAGAAAGFGETVTQNGNVATFSYDAATRTFTSTSDEGRQFAVTRDASGRVTRLARAGLLPVDVSRDGRGRVIQLQQGNRITTFGYAGAGTAEGYLAQMEGAEGDVTEFGRDALGELIATSRAGATTLLERDEAGHLTGFTVPTGDEHQMTYTLQGALSSYQPPVLPGEPNATTYAYDTDGNLAVQTLPDGSVLQRTQDEAGRLETMSFPGGLIEQTYYPPGVSGAGHVSDILGPYGTNLHYTYDGRLTTGCTWSGDGIGNVAWQYNGMRHPHSPGR
ncbi:MAG: hypothetical protein ABI895_33645 [Deltaproteobacteria bacterium]